MPWPPRSDEVYKCLWRMFKQCAECDYIPVGVPAGTKLPVGICESIVLPVEEQNLPLPVGICSPSLLPVGDYFDADLKITCVPVGTCVTALPATPLANRRRVQVYNASGFVVWLGDASISSSTCPGWPLAPNTSEPFPIGPNVTLHGISGEAGACVVVMEFA